MKPEFSLLIEIEILVCKVKLCYTNNFNKYPRKIMSYAMKCIHESTYNLTY